MANGNTQNETLKSETKDARITNSSEQWQRFDNWMKRYGYQSLAEGFRAAMNKVIEQDITQINTDSQEKNPNG